MNWLITGGCGFIGRNLVQHLVREGGHSIRVLDDLSVGTREDLAALVDLTERVVVKADFDVLEDGAVELIVGDILDESVVRRAARGADVLVHLAANTGVAPSVEDPRRDCVVNVIGTLNCLEAARHERVSRFVFASSGAPIGECTPPIHEELAPRPVSPYGASKLAGEGYCSAYYRTFGVDTVALRLGNVYGPNSSHKSSVVAKFIRKALNGEVLEIYGDGKQTRDFIYVEDLLLAIVMAAKVDGVGGEVFQIATSAETTVERIVELINQGMEEMGLPRREVRYGQARQGDVRRNFSDTSKAARTLHWNAEVPLEAGIMATVKWFVNGRTRTRTSQRSDQIQSP